MPSGSRQTNQDGGCPVEMVIQIPEQFKWLGEAVESLVRTVQEIDARGRAGKELGCKEVEDKLEQAAGEIERAAVRSYLQGLEVNEARVEIEGKAYARVGRCEGTYRTKAGPVKVERALYREVGRRNARVVDAVSLKAGVIEDGWLPGCAQAMGYLLAQGTSREAEQTAKQVGRLPYSRCSFERVGHAVGGQYAARQEEIEEQLAKAREVRPEAESISVSLDRVSLPMEEEREEEGKRKVVRQWRMAYVGCVAVNDKEGRMVESRRYGCMPGGDEKKLSEALAADVEELKKKKGGLKVVHVGDGAPEIWKLLCGAVEGQQVVRLIDYWHTVEKLARAAQVLPGEAAQRQGKWKLELLNNSKAARGILKELEDSGLEYARVGENEPVHEAITYLRNGLDKMDYASARKAGLPIGSGGVEATCKSLVSVRMRRAGARWKHETGNHVLQLRALVLSDCWDLASRLTLEPLRTAVARAA